MSNILPGTRISLPLSENFARQIFGSRDNNPSNINLRRELGLENTLQKNSEIWIPFLDTDEFSMFGYIDRDKYFDSRLTTAKNKLSRMINIKVTSQFIVYSNILLNNKVIGRLFGLWTDIPILVLEITQPIKYNVADVLREFMNQIKEDDTLFSKNAYNRRVKTAVEYNTLSNRLKNKIPQNVLKYVIKPMHSEHNIGAPVLALSNKINRRRTNNKRTRKNRTRKNR